MDNSLETTAFYEQEFFGSSSPATQACADQVVQDICGKLFPSVADDSGVDRECMEQARPFVDNLCPRSHSGNEKKSSETAPTVPQANVPQGPAFAALQNKVLSSETAPTVPEANVPQGPAFAALQNKVSSSSLKELPPSERPTTSSAASRSPKCLVVALEASDVSFDEAPLMHSPGHSKLSLTSKTESSKPVLVEPMPAELDLTSKKVIVCLKPAPEPIAQERQFEDPQLGGARFPRSPSPARTKCAADDAADLSPQATAPI